MRQWGFPAPNFTSSYDLHVPRGHPLTKAPKFQKGNFWLSHLISGVWWIKVMLLFTSAISKFPFRCVEIMVAEGMWRKHGVGFEMLTTIHIRTPMNFFFKILEVGRILAWWDSFIPKSWIPSTIQRSLRFYLLMCVVLSMSRTKVASSYLPIQTYVQENVPAALISHISVANHPRER